MSRVPHTIPVSVAQGDDAEYRTQALADGTLKRIIIWYPQGTGTDLRITPKLDKMALNESDESGGSDSIPDYIIGSNVAYRLDVDIDVRDGQELVVGADNVSAASDLDAQVIFVVDYRGDPL